MEHDLLEIIDRLWAYINKLESHCDASDIEDDDEVTLDELDIAEYRCRMYI